MSTLERSVSKTGEWDTGARIQDVWRQEVKWEGKAENIWPRIHPHLLLFSCSHLLVLRSNFCSHSNSNLVGILETRGLRTNNGLKEKGSIVSLLRWGARYSRQLNDELADSSLSQTPLNTFIDSWGQALPSVTVRKELLPLKETNQVKANDSEWGFEHKPLQIFLKIYNIKRKGQLTILLEEKKILFGT